MNVVNSEEQLLSEIVLSINDMLPGIDFGRLKYKMSGVLSNYKIDIQDDYTLKSDFPEKIKLFIVIVKWFKPKGERDSDIAALLDLDGVDYFPVLYAYQKNKFLIMEKVKGQDVGHLISRNLITNDELKMVKEQYKEAVTISIERQRYDWDMKLEHLLWNKDTKKLRLIDLGLYDPYPTPYPSLQEAVKNCLKHFDTRLMEYGRKIE